MFDGIVYKCYCEITNKYYIGITITTLEQRKGQHLRDAFNPSMDKYNCHFYRALRKYGKDSFIWDKILQISCSNKEDLIFSLKNLEIKYVDQYNSYDNRYNSTRGGDTITIMEKPVDAYDINGELINTFSSRKAASDYFGLSEDTISAGCSKKQKFSLVNGKRIIFRNSGIELTLEELEEVKSQKGQANTKVIAINSYNNEIIGKFNSIKQAAQMLNVAPSSISECLRGKRISAGKYQNNKILWKFDEDQDVQM